MFAMSDIVVVEVTCEAPAPADFHGQRVGYAGCCSVPGGDHDRGCGR